jgi:hypothetical protein
MFLSKNIKDKRSWGKTWLKIKTRTKKNRRTAKKAE